MMSGVSVPLYFERHLISTMDDPSELRRLRQQLRDSEAAKRAMEADMKVSKECLR